MVILPLVLRPCHVRNANILCFEQVPLDSAAVLERIQVLKGEFTKLPKQPQCFALTAEILYRNAEEYLLKIILQEN